MEPPTKRRRVSSTHDHDSYDSEYPSGPPEGSKNANLDINLQNARIQLDMRLKSTFEAIFAKYSQDFTGIGDEIDLETGEVVINNGHLEGMRDEQDVGEETSDMPPNLEEEPNDNLADDQADDEGESDDDDHLGMVTAPAFPSILRGDYEGGN